MSSCRATNANGPAFWAGDFGAQNAEAAQKACKAAQPRERSSYIPTMVVASDTKYPRGYYVSRWEVEGE